MRRASVLAISSITRAMTDLNKPMAVAYEYCGMVDPKATCNE